MHESTWKLMLRSSASGASSPIGSTMPRVKDGAEPIMSTVFGVISRL